MSMVINSYVFGGAAAPAITGAAEEFATLTTDATTPQWQRGSGSFFYDIPGETGGTYQPSYVDVGVALRVRDTVTGLASSATSPVAAKPAFLDTFTEAGTGSATIAGHQADIGGTYAVHTLGVAGVNIDRDNDRAVGATGSGSNYFINNAPITSKRLRYFVNVFRSGGIPAVLPAFTKDTALDGYRFYNDGGWTWQRFNAGSAVSVHSTGFANPPVGAEYALNFTLEEMAGRVRLRYQGPAHTVEPVQSDDTNALRKPIEGRYIGVGPRTGTYLDNLTAWHMDDSPVVSEDAIWTWYNDPRAIRHSSVDYVAHIDKVGSVNLSKIDAGVTTQVAVGVANSPVDDHNNAALLVLPGGRIMVAFSDHQDTVGTRYKVSTNALPDISAFGGQVTIAKAGGATEVTYANLSLLSDGNVRCIRRGLNGIYEMCKATAATVEAGTATWATTTVIDQGHAYAKMVVSDDGHRLYFLFGTGHPDANDTALYGCYLDVSTGSEVWKDLTGATITAPVTSANATLIRSVPIAAGPNNWTWDIGLGADGQPRFLGTRYPGGHTAPATTTMTDIEYWHYRWTGSAVVQTQLASGQKSLYAAQPYYAGGMCFDGNDPTIIYMSTLDADSYYQLGEYRFDETTATLTKVRNISSRAIAHNARPFSPKGHGSDVAVYWWRGKYTSYLGYDTALHRSA